MAQGRVLIVHEGGGKTSVRRWLKAFPVSVEVVDGIKAAVDVISDKAFHAILLEVRAGNGKLEDIFRTLREHQAEAPVIVMAESGDSHLAEKVRAAGAFEFIHLPVERQILLRVIRRALLRSGLIMSEDLGEPQIKEPVRQFPFLVGTSERMKSVLRQIARVAQTDANVCLYGGTGTGKELVARAIHYSSARANRALIVFDCTAVPEGLMETELFGHVKGSFTSAVADREGVFQMAHGGTLFFDEIGELSLPFQAKLLRVIQCREFRKVGGKDPIRVDVRLIAATNRNLGEMVTAGKFREDLLYRLEVISITLPPLCERKEDIPLLVDHFIQRFNAHNEKQIRGVNPKTMGAVLRYHWPGNVRELENCIERAAVMSEGDILNIENLSELLRPTRSQDHSASSMDDSCLRSLKDAERDYILRTLQYLKGDRVQAAHVLGISLRSLYYKIRGMEGSLVPPGKRKGSSGRRPAEDSTDAATNFG